jgi:hypothetical protein
MERRASPPVELCHPLNVSSESSRVRPPGPEKLIYYALFCKGPTR